jgi:hypothetical protein
VTLDKGSIKVTALAVGCGAIGLLSYNWYYTRFLWPASVQRSVVGAELVSNSELNNYDGFTAYGQGAHRWTYDVVGNSHLRKMCAPQPLSTCSFVRTRRLNSDVEQTVKLKTGVLIVEEVWS